MKRVVVNGFLNMPPLTVEFCWNFRGEVEGRFLGADSVVAGVASVRWNNIRERGNLPWSHSGNEDYDHTDDTSMETGQQPGYRSRSPARSLHTSKPPPSALTTCPVAASLLIR